MLKQDQIKVSLNATKPLAFRFINLKVESKEFEVQNLQSVIPL